MRFLRTLLILTLLAPVVASAQDELLDDLNKGAEKEPVMGVFNTTRLVNLHTTETAGKNVLEFRMTHRFGAVSEGEHGLWGLDASSDIRFGFDYGITNRLMVGIGRSKVNERLDGFVKFRLLRQHHGGLPFSVTVMANMAYDPSRNLANQLGQNKFPTDVARLSYVSQAIISSKLHRRISIMVAPTLLHRNFVGAYSYEYYAETNVDGKERLVTDANDLFALGGGLRVRVSKMVTLTGDYTHVFSDFQDNKPASQPAYNMPIGIGTEIEVGGHVFMINATNSAGIIANQFLTQNPTTLDAGGWRLGFTIVRVFTPGKRIVKRQGEKESGGANVQPSEDKPKEKKNRKERRNRSRRERE